MNLAQARPLQLMPSAKTRLRVVEVRRAGFVQPLRDFKLDYRWDGEAIVEVVRDRADYATLVVVTGKRGEAELFLDLHMPDGSYLTQRYAVGLIDPDGVPDEFVLDVER